MEFPALPMNRRRVCEPSSRSVIIPSQYLGARADAHGAAIAANQVRRLTLYLTHVDELAVQDAAAAVQHIVCRIRKMLTFGYFLHMTDSTEDHRVRSASSSIKDTSLLRVNHLRIL